MKILVIVHQFPPKESAGTEVYAWKLAKALQERGHDLSVYYTQRHQDLPQYQMLRGTYDSLETFEVVNNHEFGTFRGTYHDEDMEKHLRTVLDEVKPDIVHIQHLHLHSIDYIGIIKESGIPVVYTLAEYLNICPRNGWMAKMDFTLCEGPETHECAKCARGVWPAPGKDELPPSVDWDMGPQPAAPYKRFSVTRFIGKAKRKITGEPPPEAPVPAPEPRSLPAPAVDPFVPAVERRWRETKAQLDQVDLFVAPSRFLRERYIEAGMVDADRIVYSDYGFDHEPFAGLEPVEKSSGNLVVGFIGSIAEQKGVHLLVEAFNELPEEGVECRIYGGLTGWPDYVAEVRALRSHVGVRFMGRYANDRIAEVLREFDVLVVPSRWYENSPLTIHEAFMAGIPVITGNRGGMAELVEHEKSGLHFIVDDGTDLRRQIERLLKEPELLERMRGQLPAVKDITEDAREMEERFRELVEQGVHAG